jgi:hypothetical protein
MATVTALVEYDETYSDEELDELELQLTNAGVSAQIQPRGIRAGVAEWAVWLSVLLGTVTAEILIEKAMRLLWQAILSAARRHRRLAPPSGQLNQDYPVNGSVTFEFNGHRLVVRGDDLDDVEALDLLAATSRLVTDDQEPAKVWVWDSASGKLRPIEKDEG